MKEPENKKGLDKFSIIERVKDAIYYITFQRKGLRAQSLGSSPSKSGATRIANNFATRNGIKNFMTLYYENHLTKTETSLNTFDHPPKVQNNLRPRRT